MPTRYSLCQVLPPRHLCILVVLKRVHAGPVFFFFNDTPTTEIYTLSLHDALPILQSFIASMTQKLTLSDISDESKNYLDKAGITTACLRIKSKWTAGGK